MKPNSQLFGQQMNSAARDKLRIRNARLQDAHELAPHMRDADKQEVAVLANVSPLEALTMAFADPAEKRVLTIELPNGQIGAIAGVSTNPSRNKLKIGMPWLLGSDALFKDHWREFCRRSREGFARLDLAYDRYENYVWIGNPTHLRWLKRMGARFGTPVPHGLNRRLFVRFCLDARKIKPVNRRA